jgi:hypothetical protein
MSVTPFPRSKAKFAPVVEMLAPGVSPSGLYEITIWRNQTRNEGYLVKVPTHSDALTVLRLITESQKGENAHG